MKTPATARQRAEYAAFRCVAGLVAALPAPAAAALCRGLAAVVCALPHKINRGKVARENLAVAFPELSPQEADERIRGMWTHLFRLVTEMVLFERKMRLGNLMDVISFYHRDETTRALNSGRPLIMLGGHFGNWEVSAASFGAFGIPISVVARDMDNPLIHEWFAGKRRASGGRLISKKGGGGEVTEVLESGGIVGLLGDQDAGSRGQFVPFFGKDASTFKSIALLASEYDALVLVGYARRLPDDFRRNRWVRFEVGTEAVFDPRDFTAESAVKDLTAAYTAAIERVVRKSPEQYFWVHRRWKSVPKPRGRKARERAAALAKEEALTSEASSADRAKAA
ncbi:lysophospholipid acyltransferase family protein [Alienimonas chondri]|uniref:Lipid A biosynthesis lauroyltransferase n=1 Tax=Alienimonas chondri TaxID=2681879 RepID=A0ABX1V8I3_9PLAN|nr:lysophospholipid acyltransferase family protein [Alienimonas chondri]NNJ24447.1 Lipid A biosynthesis lauroyltransferase [Alienimonas chondri]